MRALVAEADMLSALRVSDALADAGLIVIGPARSSGEALVLAHSQRPDVAVLGIDLESAGVGHRLANRLHADLKISCLLMTQSSAADDERTKCSVEIFNSDDYGEIALAAKRRPRRRSE